MRTNTNIVVRYQETDRMGIVHHSVYPIYYEQARTDYIKQTGFKYSDFEKMGLYTPLYDMYSKFMKSITYEDEIRVETRIDKLTPVRIVFAYDVYNKENELINSGYTSHAFVGGDLRPVNCKKDFPDIYEKMNKIYLEDQGEKRG